MNNKKKIIFSIILSALITSNVGASVYMPKKSIDADIKKEFQQEYLELSSNILSPFQIQGNFETGWIKKNFWNANDNGGVAIGPYQIHSVYLLEPFFNYLKKNSPKYYDMLNEMGGVKAIKRNNPEMREFFCNLCEMDREFVRQQENFIDKENFQPRVKAIKSKYGIDISQRSSSIEGLFRIMSANIGWRTYDVIKDMVKNASVYDMDINALSDIEFTKVLQQSIHTVIQRDIKPKFRKQLVAAYDRSINNDIIPNIKKEAFVEMQKNNIKPYNNVAISQNVKSFENNTINHKHIDVDKKYFIKREDEETNVVLPLPSNDKNKSPMPPKKPDIIMVSKVMEKNEPTPERPSLLRRAEMIRAQHNLEMGISASEISQKKIR